MGAPARRIEADPFAYRSNHLRLVTTPPVESPSRFKKGASTRTKGAATATKTKRSARTSAPNPATRARLRREEARARTVFWAFVGVLAFAVVLGSARVTLIVRAAEATITQSRVQADIKAQRAEADALEVDRSSLSTPSRIAGIASSSMGMAEPTSVRYISLTGAGAAGSGTAAVGGTTAATGDALGALFGAVVDLSAGEAQSLLVGDLGLAGSR